MTDRTPGDSGVTDLLLHHCDHAYRVPELLHWLEGAGMRLIEWCDKENFERLPTGFNSDKQLLELVDKLGAVGWMQSIFC